jgi:pimeloyl-ACP methyl ester carboxylesterase
MATEQAAPLPPRTMSAAATPRWALTERLSIKYTFTGSGGRPLLLLHEMGGSLESWEPVLPQLPEGWNVLRCDFRGSGGSEKILGDVTVEVLADDVISLLDHLGVAVPVDVAGVAMGGCIGLVLAARHPRRVHRLAAINPPTDAPGRSGEILRERADLAEAHGMRSVVEGALARSYPQHLRGDREAYDSYVARFLANDPRSYAHIVRALAQSELGDTLTDVACPTLFVSGRHDLLRPPAHIAGVAQRVKGARHTIIEGGHIPSVQAPRALADTLGDFFGAGEER